MQISKELLELLLPDFIINHFTFIKSNLDDESLHIHFEEINNKTVFKGLEVESKGFHKGVTIEDFPLRGKLVYLHLKRRRWRDIQTKETLQRNWKVIAKGTRMTEEFATFLKEINRY